MRVREGSVRKDNNSILIARDRYYSKHFSSVIKSIPF